MLLRIEFLTNDQKYELTLKNCDYQDFKNHFVSFTHNDLCQAKFYEIEDAKAILKADHLL